MLIYIQQLQFDKLMFQFTDNMIPLQLKNELQLEYQLEEERIKELAEAHLYLHFHIVTSDDISIHCKTSHLVDLIDIRQIPVTKVLKTNTFEDLHNIIKNKINIPINKQKIWSLQKRTNNTLRVDQLIKINNNCQLINSNLLKDCNFNIFVEELENDENMNNDNDDMLIHIKYFDADLLEIIYLGHYYANSSTTINQLFNKIVEKNSKKISDTENSMKNNEKIIKLNESEKSNWTIYEEVKPNRIDKINNNNDTIDELELGNGDILVIQTNKNEKWNVVNYYDFIYNRVQLDIRMLQSPKESIAMIDVSKKIIYNQLAEKIGEKLKIEPQYIRVTLHNNQYNQPKAHPIKYSEQITLNELLGDVTRNTIEIIYVEIIDIPLKEFEQKRLIKITWRDIYRIPQQNPINLYVDKELKYVKDILFDLKNNKNVKLETNSKQIRIFEMNNNKIHSIINLNSQISTISNLYPLFAEEIDDDELVTTITDNSIEIMVAFFVINRSFGNVGNPFILRISKVIKLKIKVNIIISIRVIH